jgi:hypothetical protein
MTRFLERDNGTQVNSNLIGVQVRPQVVPPTYEVDKLTANILIDKFDCTNKMNGLPMLYAEYGSGPMIFGYTGNQMEVNGTVYKEWTGVMGTDRNPYYTDSNDTITDQTQFYIITGDPNNPVVPAPKSDYMLSYEGDLYHFDPNGYYYVYDGIYVRNYLNNNAECDLVNGFFMSKETGRYLGKYIGNSFDTVMDMACYFGGQYGGYTMWVPDYSFQIAAPAYLYSTIRNPYIGYNLISNMNGTASYVSPVTSVSKKEVDPGHIEAVDCSVEYSVDGETWTAWPENLTDDNNVIANVPRYMYLKFGQDVEITEE